MKMEYDVNLVSLIFEILEKKVEEMGGIETLKKAVVWNWWDTNNIKCEKDFKSALNECQKCYSQVMDFKEQLELRMEETDEDTANFPS